MSHRKEKGFTLVELLVVIAIIGILVALLLPAVQAAREAARRMQCSNNLKQLALTLHNYHDVNRCFPSAIVRSDAAGRRGASWLVRILPFMEETAAYEAITFNDTDWTMQSNRINRNWMITNNLRVDTLYCPSSAMNRERRQNTNSATQALGAPGSIKYQLVNYVGISGSYNRGRDLRCCPNPSKWTGYGRSNWNGVLISTDSVVEDPVRFKDMVDGTSTTFCVGEQSSYWINPDNQRKYDYRACNHDGGPWSCGAGGAWGWWLNVTVVRYPINSNIGGYWGTYRPRGYGHTRPYHRHTIIRSAHPGGAQVALTDGSVRMVRETINMTILTRLCDRADRKPIGAY